MFLAASNQDFVICISYFIKHVTPNFDSKELSNVSHDEFTVDTK